MKNKGVMMLQIAKICVQVGAGVGMCATGPAWATVAVVSVVALGTVSVITNKTE